MSGSLDTSMVSALGDRAMLNFSGDCCGPKGSLASPATAWAASSSTIPATADCVSLSIASVGSTVLFSVSMMGKRS